MSHHEVPELKQISDDLLVVGQYEGVLTKQQVEVLLLEIFLIVIRRIAPVKVHQLSVEMDANIAAGLLYVNADVQLINPPVPPFTVHYALGNDPSSDGKLQLVEKIQVRAGLAQLMIQAMGIPHLVHEQLKDPNTLVKSCVPELLGVNDGSVQSTMVHLQLLDTSLALKLHILRA